MYEKDGKLLMMVKRSSNSLYKLIVPENEPVCLLTKAEENTW